MHWYDEEKFDDDHCWGLKGENGQQMLVPRVSHLETEFTVIIERLMFDRVALTGILQGGPGIFKRRGLK